MDELTKYGLPGLICGILIVAIRWGVMFIKDMLKEHKEERETLEKRAREEREANDKFHRDERDSLKLSISKQYEQMNNQARETNIAIKENTAATSSLTNAVKMILENKK